MSDLPRPERSALEKVEERVGIYSGAVRHKPVEHRIIAVLDVITAKLFPQKQEQ